MSATNTVLNGKTAGEIRELIAARTVTAKQVVAFLESKPKLRAPSAKLLAELKGAAPAKPAAAKATKPEGKTEAKATKPEASKPAKTVSITVEEFASLVERVAALEAKVLAKASEPVVEAKPAKAKKPKAEAKATPAPEPVVAPVPEPVETVVEIPTVSSVREALEALPLKTLRQNAKDLGITATKKAEIIEAIIAQARDEGEVIEDEDTDGADEMQMQSWDEMFDEVLAELGGELF
jgi:hypothetical protein